MKGLPKWINWIQTLHNIFHNHHLLCFNNDRDPKYHAINVIISIKTTVLGAYSRDKTRFLSLPVNVDTLPGTLNCLALERSLLLHPENIITLLRERPQERYRQTSNISHNKSQKLNVLCLVLQVSLPNPLKPGVKSEWRCSSSSADRWCSNYIWVINNFIANHKVWLLLEVWQYLANLIMI